MPPKDTRVPSVSRSPWLTVAAAAVGSSLSIPVYNFYLFGLFLKPVAHAFGWGRGEVALALTVTTYVTMLTTPLVGAVVDRVRLRRLILCSIAALALAIAAQSGLRPNRIWFYAGHAVIAVAGLGTLPITYTAAVVSRFDRGRGLALGLTLAGVGLGGALFPVIVQQVIDDHGWRFGYLAIGALMLAIAWPSVALLLRDAPSGNADARIGPLAADQRMTFRAALRGRVFWLLFVILTLLGVASSGTTTHLAALLTDRGVSPRVAARSLELLGVMLIVGRIGAGFMLDRFRPALVACAVITAAAVGLGLVVEFTTPGAVIAGIALVGIGLGSEFDFLSFFVARLIGMRDYGTVYGTIYSGFMLGSGIGAPLVGFAFDRTHSYTFPMLALAGIEIIAALLFLGLLPTPGRATMPSATQAFAGERPAP